LALVDDGPALFLELGGRPVLTTAILDCAVEKARVVAVMGEDRPQRETFLSAVGTAFVAGHELNWAKLYPNPMGAVDLPRMPWNPRLTPGSVVRPESSAYLARDLELAEVGERGLVARDAIARCLADMLDVSPEKLDTSLTFRELGLKSMMIIQLQTILAKALGKRLDRTALVDFPSIETLARHLAGPDIDAREESASSGGARVSSCAEVELAGTIEFGEACVVSPFSRIKATDGRLCFGARCFIGTACSISAGPDGIAIGDDFSCGANVTIGGSTVVDDGLAAGAGIRIGHKVEVGNGATILDGTEIGDNCVVVAGAMVRGSYPPNSGVGDTWYPSPS
ncbi:MAG: hypothetical protein HN348_23000, partial [Proteobacteria bacterium]|nr:hypothetical protein [Pseudomonadota bacterium]